MTIKLEINESKAEFFLEYLHSLKDGIIEKIVINDNPSFIVNSVDEVIKRVEIAEKNANYIEHNKFWDNI